MAGWRHEPGATLLVPSGPHGLHLFIILLGPVALPSYGPDLQTGMVSVTTIRSGVPHDVACELRAGDHPFVRHPSYVAYRYMRIDRATHIAQMVASGVWKTHEPCTPELLARVTAGARRSRLIPRAFKPWFPE